MNALFEYVNASALFRDYLPHIRCKYLKMRGVGTNGKPMYFTEQEKADIINAIQLMAQHTAERYRQMPVADLYRTQDNNG